MAQAAGHAFTAGSATVRPLACVRFALAERRGNPRPRSSSSDLKSEDSTGHLRKPEPATSYNRYATNPPEGLTTTSHTSGTQVFKSAYRV